MATELELPTHTEATDDQEKELQNRVNLCYGKVANTGKNADEAVGKTHHPRLLIEHHLAVTQLEVANTDLRLHGTQRLVYEQGRLLAEQTALIDRLLGFVNDIPQRLLLLENSYAHLALIHGRVSFTDQVVTAYELGKKANADKKS